MPASRCLARVLGGQALYSRAEASPACRVARLTALGIYLALCMVLADSRLRYCAEPVQSCGRRAGRPLSPRLPHSCWHAAMVCLQLSVRVHENIFPGKGLAAPPPPPPPPSVLGRSSYVLGRSHCRLTACAHRPTLPKAKCSCAGCGVDGADGLWCRSDGASVQLHPCRHVSREQSRDCFWTDVLYKRPRCADYWLFSLPLSPVGSTCLIYVRFSILADLLYAV